MKKYAIWNKHDPIITPIGEVLTAEQWIKRYPVAGLENITVVCATGEINGAFFGTLGNLVNTYELQGCDFSSCESPEDKLMAIEAFEKKREEEAAAAAKAKEDAENLNTASLASIAASMEYQNMLTLDDIEEV